MSFCRWSSDDFMCDLYIYESCYGGYTTHVAVNRLERRPIPSVDFSDPDLYMETSRKQREDIKTIKHKTIGLPYDGQTFNDETPEELLARVYVLRDLGYQVPQFAIDAIIEEIKETKNNV